MLSLAVRRSHELWIAHPSMSRLARVLRDLVFCFCLLTTPTRLDTVSVRRVKIANVSPTNFACDRSCIALVSCRVVSQLCCDVVSNITCLGNERFRQIVD